MPNDTDPHHLDALLASAAPRGGGPTPEGDRVLAAAISEARPSLAKWRRRPARTALIAGATALVLTGGGFAAAATIQARSGPQPWGSLTVEASKDATIFEWPVALPDGTQCVERLTGFGLSDAVAATIRATLDDPSAILAGDNGAVRAEFLGYLDSGTFSWSGDRASFEAVVDAGYAAVARMDASSGRGAVADTELSVLPGSETNQLFDNTEMRLVLDGLKRAGVNPYETLEPETACKVSP
jgi:hypothetical protein